MLSKSRYLKGVKCTKALWLNKFKKEEAVYNTATLQVFDQGNTAGELAQHYFPGGQLALVSNFPDSGAIRKTQQLIDEGVTTIYEATFAAQSTLVAVDILHKIDGEWHAFEVKSTNSVKPEHIRDAAIQYFVMTKAGIALKNISIMFFDRNYVKLGDINPNQLFRYESVLGNIQPYLSEIPTNIEAFLAVYQQEEPSMLIGAQCLKPYPCEFMNYCHQLPENQEILENEEVKPQLSSEVIFQNSKAIQHFLSENPYPIYSFDFETIMHAIPEFDNSRPYQQIPFQYSLQYQQEANAEPIHYEFLGNGKDDPREPLIQQMISDFSNNGSILVYSITFEKTRMNELIRDFPTYKHELENIKNRFVDLLPVYKKYLLTERTKKSASLKKVTPTFLPHLSYEELEIQQGMATMDVYRNLANETNLLELAKRREEMLAYCKLDTQAVLELYQKLYEYI